MQQARPNGCLAIPPTGKGSAVLVLHAWRGLNDTLQAFSRRLAEIAEAAHLGHFAGMDEFEPQSGVDNLEATLRQAGRRHPGPMSRWRAEPMSPNPAFNRTGRYAVSYWRAWAQPAGKLD